MDITFRTEQGLLERGDRFTLYEGAHTHTFEWLPFERLHREYFYPSFLKQDIFHLPKMLILRVEEEYERPLSLKRLHDLFENGK